MMSEKSDDAMNVAPGSTPDVKGRTGSALLAENLVVTYGSVTAVRGVTIAVEPGEICAVIGANGAGKTSLLRAICGLVPLNKGTISMGGKVVSGLRTEDRTRLGLTLVPEGRGVFSSMSVDENLRVAGGGRRDASSHMEELYESFPLLQPLRHRRSGYLSGGEQQILSLARALMTRPSVLLLDEPSMGLAPVAVVRVLDALGALGAAGPGILLVEQNAQIALKLAKYVYGMEHGEIVFQGFDYELNDSEAVRRLYFGE